MNDAVPLDISLSASFQHIITYIGTAKANLVILMRPEDFKNTRMNTNNHLQAEFCKSIIHNQVKVNFIVRYAEHT